MKAAIVARPESFRPERDYVQDLVLRRWLGLEHRTQFRAEPGIGISLDGGGHWLEMPDVLFDRPETSPPSAAWLPKAPLPGIDLGRMGLGSSGETVPVLFGDGDLTRSGYCPIDVFGSAFFMLSRLEETIAGERDEHGRFPASRSCAARYGFLRRPIVNIYLDILVWSLRRMWPVFRPPTREFRVVLSHDVDSPFGDLYRGPGSALRRAAQTAIKAGAPLRAFSEFARWKSVRNGNLSRDPLNTFAFIMEASERRGLKSAFFFIPQGSSERAMTYDVTDAPIRSLMRTISDRGHEIGYHGSYDSYDAPAAMGAELAHLRATLDSLGLRGDGLGGRQHYLRWRMPDTPRAQASAGMSYDSTLGYAEAPGFRCGTCWDFPLYDLTDRKVLDLIERPLVVMEDSISAKYLGIADHDSALRGFAELKAACKRYRGDFTMLWHNSELATERMRRLFLEVLDA